MTKPSWLTRTGATGALAVAALTAPAPSSADPQAPAAASPAVPAKTPSNLETIFKDIKLTDQYGAELKPAEVFEGKPVLVLFGYNGCPRCSTIADTAAVIQQKFISSNQNVPIVLVSVQPETDGKGDKPREYLVKYYQEGLRQYQSEELKEGDKERATTGSAAFDKVAAKDEAAKKLDQKARIFHIVFPPSEQKSKELQTLIGESLKSRGSKRTFVIDPNDFKQHTWFATLFDGKGNTVDAYRLVDAKSEAPPAFTSTLATTISNRVAEISKAPGK